MKFYNVLLAIIITSLLYSCIGAKNNRFTSLSETQTIEENPFLGVWSRSFELGKKDSTTYVYYRMFADSIQYEMAGPLALKYTMLTDTFLHGENRWVGTLHGHPYVIFIKNHIADSISLLKKKVKTKQEALTMAMPSDTARSHFTSWNVYYKQ